VAEEDLMERVGWANGCAELRITIKELLAKSDRLIAIESVEEYLNYGKEPEEPVLTEAEINAKNLLMM
jgi:hypothetical protein